MVVKAYEEGQEDILKLKEENDLLKDTNTKYLAELTGAKLEME